MMAPWLFFLFAGVVNLGFYTYAAMSIENAARVAALDTSSSAGPAGDNASACTYAVSETRGASGSDARNGLQRFAGHRQRHRRQRPG